MAVNTKSAAHSAAGQYLGFALQPVRLCHHLLTAPEGSKVSLEHADDVAVHYPNGATLLEQCKSALSQNPASDWARDLWKTIANWMNSTASDYPPQAEIQYHLFVCPTRNGGFVSSLCAAETDAEIDKAVFDIRTALADLQPKPACQKNLKQFLDAPQSEQRRLVRAFTLVTADDPLESVKAQLKLSASPDAIDSFCAWAIGQAKEQADALIRAKEPAVIDASRFQEMFRDFVKKNNLPALLPFSRPPNPAHVESVLSDRPTFVQQLELVDATSDEKLRSVSDYMRSSADKSAWADAGQLFQHTLDDWDTTLIGRHAAIAGTASITHKLLPAPELGRYVYLQCSQLALPLEGLTVPGHFINGCFNELANRLKLGWHADYAVLLGKDDEL